MGDTLSALLDRGSLEAAAWAGLVGTALLLLLGLLRRRRTPRGERGVRLEAPPPEPPASRRQRAAAAYAAQDVPAAGNPASSRPADLPMTSRIPPAAPACPPALSRRIDRLEAKVRARRAGSHG